MRVANWNVEWMNDWFVPVRDGGPAWRAGPIEGARPVADVRGLADRVAAVIWRIAPDLIAIQEGPSRAGEMRLFVDDHLDGAFDVLGPTGRGTQRLYVLVRRGGAIEAAARLWPAPGEIDFDLSWPVDVVGDLVIEPYDFTRTPLTVAATVGGKPLVVVNVHSKSKYVHGGRALWENEATRPQFVAQAVRNRRRIAAELMRLRSWIEDRLEREPEARMIVLGDLNDGPGVDFFERNYLIHNVVGVVSGNPFTPRTMLRHAFIDRELRDRNWTARFDDFVDGIPDRPLLLDHILLSPALNWGAFRNARIDHEAFEAQLRPDLPGRAAAPSDHRPQRADFDP